MTIEEIEKAGKRYAYNIIPDENGMTFPVERSELSKAFKEGVQFSDKHWQEKTRWIPIEERLPKGRENEYPVYAKNERKKNNYAILVIEDSISIHYLKKAFTHWKEIE